MNLANILQCQGRMTMVLDARLAAWREELCIIMELELNGHNFTGYDYSSGSHFSGTVSGSGVSVYDYGSGQYYSYTA